MLYLIEQIAQSNVYNMDNSIKILNAFSKGGFSGADTEMPKHIVTAISDIFVCRDRAYKIYKKYSNFFNENFNDLSKKEKRFDFTNKDFKWNNRLSPEIYLELKGVVWNNEAIFVNPSIEADELVIVMKKIDMSDSLISRLTAGTISLEDSYAIGFQLGKRISNLPKVLPSGLNLYDSFISRHKEIVSWIRGVEDYISEDEFGGYCDTLLSIIQSNKEYFQGNNELLGYCLDIHADNAIFSNSILLPIDTYSPKEEWLCGYKYISVYRIATDIYAFLGREYFDEVIKGYEDATHEKIPRKFDLLMILYSELIICPYQYMLSEKDKSRLALAQKHLGFLRETIKLFNTQAS